MTSSPLQFEREREIARRAFRQEEMSKLVKVTFFPSTHSLAGSCLKLGKLKQSCDAVVASALKAPLPFPPSCRLPNSSKTLGSGEEAREGRVLDRDHTDTANLTSRSSQPHQPHQPQPPILNLSRLRLPIRVNNTTRGLRKIDRNGSDSKKHRGDRYIFSIFSVFFSEFRRTSNPHTFFCRELQ